jgi:hypothetical protein
MKEFKQVPTIQTPCGPVFAHNKTMDFEGFYLSHNWLDDNTAICGPGFFFILKGDHREGMASAANNGVSALAKYFAENIGEASTTSEHPWACGMKKTDPLRTRDYALKVFSADDLEVIRLAVMKERTNGND